MFTTAALAAAEATLNAVLELDPQTLGRLEKVAGKVVAIEIEGLGQRVYLRPHAGGLDLMGDYAGVVETTLRGTPMALYRMGNGKPGEGLFGDGVTLSGDIELAQRLQRILGGLDIDWEEHISHLTGDIIAHQLGNSVRVLTRWAQRNNRSCERDISEYLRYEADTLPLDWEVEAYMSGVDSIRGDLDRLEARIKRLLQPQ